MMIVSAIRTYKEIQKLQLENFFLFFVKLKLIEDVSLLGIEFGTGDNHSIAGYPVHIPTPTVREQFAVEFSFVREGPGRIVRSGGAIHSGEGQRHSAVTIEGVVHRAAVLFRDVEVAADQNAIRADVAYHRAAEMPHADNGAGSG